MSNISSTKEATLLKLRKGDAISLGEQFKLTMILAYPAILGQLAMCLMSYIDASMVGRLGSGPAASVGLVSTSTWILASLCFANSSGFSVQIAHRCGASDFESAAKLVRLGLLTVFATSIFLMLLGIVAANPLPYWLGAEEDIVADASSYFFFYAAFLPGFQLAAYGESILNAIGNSIVPGVTCICMCVLDVVFNYLFIFVLDMGTTGAAIGTGLATTCGGVFLILYAFTKSPEFKSSARNLWRQTRKELYPALRKAVDITWPLWLQNIISRGAYVAATVLIAPLGTIAIAANSFAIIAEGFCYLPGYGFESSASTLVGQSLGAERKDIARKFARINIMSGAGAMTFLAILMWLFAPWIMSMLSQDPEVIVLGAKCLRIEAWAELLYGVSIVAYGCCLGAGDTLVPSLINLLSMWVIRLGLALILIPRMGLTGYWLAMAIELSVKGLIFIVRIRGNRWLEKKKI